VVVERERKVQRNRQVKGEEEDKRRRNQKMEKEERINQ